MLEKLPLDKCNQAKEVSMDMARMSLAARISFPNSKVNRPFSPRKISNGCNATYES